MREILYRAISLCKGERWLYGQVRHYNHNPHTEKWTIYDSETRIETDIDPTTIGEYTGLVDKNGSKIFEGDILDVYIQDSHVCNGKHRIRKVTFINSGFYITDEHDNVICDKVSMCQECIYTIIGNVFDNKDLLKGGNNA